MKFKRFLKYLSAAKEYSGNRDLRIGLLAEKFNNKWADAVWNTFSVETEMFRHKDVIMLNKIL